VTHVDITIRGGTGGNPTGDRQYRARSQRENGIARFNLSWLLEGEKTGDGTVPDWVGGKPE